MSASVNVRSVWVVHWHKVCVCARSYVSFDLKRDINKEQTCKTINRILLNIFYINSFVPDFSVLRFHTLLSLAVVIATRNMSHRWQNKSLFIARRGFGVFLMPKGI